MAPYSITVTVSTASDDKLNPELSGFRAPSGHTINPMGHCRLCHTAMTTLIVGSSSIHKLDYDEM